MLMMCARAHSQELTDITVPFAFAFNWSKFLMDAFFKLDFPSLENLRLPVMLYKQQFLYPPTSFRLFLNRRSRPLTISSTRTLMYGPLDFHAYPGLAFSMEADTSEEVAADLIAVDADVEVLQFLVAQDITTFSPKLVRLAVKGGIWMDGGTDEETGESAFPSTYNLIRLWVEQVKEFEEDEDELLKPTQLSTLSFSHSDHHLNGSISPLSAAEFLENLDYLVGNNLQNLSLPFPDCEIDWIGLLFGLRATRQKRFTHLVTLELYSKNLRSKHLALPRAIFETLPSLEKITVFPAPNISSRPSGEYRHNRGGFHFKAL